MKTQNHKDATRNINILKIKKLFFLFVFFQLGGIHLPYAKSEEGVCIGPIDPISEIKEVEKISPDISPSTVIDMMKAEFMKFGDDPSPRSLQLAYLLQQRLCQVNSVNENLLAIREAENSEHPLKLRTMIIESIQLIGTEDVEKFIQIINNPSLPIELRDECLAKFRQTTKLNRDIILSFLTSFIAKENDKRLLATAVWASYSYEHRPLLDSLLLRINDSDEVVRMRVVVSISNPLRPKKSYLENSKVIPALLEKLQDNDRNIVNRAIDALASLDSPNSIAVLKEQFRTSQLTDPKDKNGNRWTIARALRHMSSKDSISLAKMVIQDSNDLVAADAAKSISSRNITSLRPLLIERSRNIDPESRHSKELLEEAIQELRHLK